MRVFLNIAPQSGKKVLFDIRGKVVDCPFPSNQIVYFGQSNTGNSVKPKASIDLPNNIFQYDWQSRKCYRYKEPLIGTSGYAGNVMTYTAAKLSSESNYPIIIIPFGEGSTSVLEWAYGRLSYRQTLVLDNIKESNLSPQIFLWQQGESDHGTSQNKYKDALQIVLNRTRQYFPKSHFGVALATRCGNLSWKPVRAAQREIIKLNKHTFLSADSDKIFGKNLRRDLCHFSAEGAQILGELYYESIKDLLK